MPLIKRTGILNGSSWSTFLKLYNGWGSLMESEPAKRAPHVGLALSSVAAEGTAYNDFAKSLQEVLSSGCARSSNANKSIIEEVPGASGTPLSFGGQRIRRGVLMFQSLVQPTGCLGANKEALSFARTFASAASKQERRNSSEIRKDISKVEDPFDAPTYNIPEKPVTFAEGASYSVIILAGLGIAAAAAYAVFKELIFEPKEYKIFGKALERIQNDSQVRVRIGSPVTGYGQESRNRAARQRIPNRIWTDEDGVEHVEVNFYIRGPHGAGKVYTEMFKDKEDKQWKFTYLIVEIKSPAPAQLMLESYVPA
ncbi:hypothetical protein NMG60_11001105 [Bertholletia excelsa]